MKEYWGFRGDINNHFVDERILIRQTADSIFGAYHNLKEDGQFFTDNTLFTVLLKDQGGSLKYFLGILNSKLLNYIYKYLSMEEGKVLAQVKTALVDELPIVYDKRKEKEVVSLVDALISKKRSNHGCDVSDIEMQLDALVCDVYGLTKEEKMQVLGSFN